MIRCRLSKSESVGTNGKRARGIRGFCRLRETGLEREREGLIRHYWVLMTPDGYSSSKKSDDFCEDVCGQVLCFWFFILL